MINTKTMAMTISTTNTLREHLERAIFEAFDPWHNWSEWQENMTRPIKRPR